jgi:hypothetical protein
MTASTVRDLGRNDVCRCGSGRKYKRCCLDKDEAAAMAARATAEANAAPTEAPADSAAETSGEARARQRPPKPTSYQPWKRSATNTQGFQRMSTPRKVGGG